MAGDENVEESLSRVSGSTHSITFKSSGSTHPFNFKSSDSTRAFRPLCLQALVPSSGPCTFRPCRAPWALMPSGPRAFMPSCLLQVLISSLSWSSLPHMLFNCLLDLLVPCILLSDRFCHLPSWALPPHSVIISLSDSTWSSPPFRYHLPTRLSPLTPAPQLAHLSLSGSPQPCHLFF